MDLVYSTNPHTGQDYKTLCDSVLLASVFSVDPEVDQPTEEIPVLQMANPPLPLDHQQIFS